jgi:hypothetical protein
MRVDRTRGVQQPSKLKIAEFDSPYPLQGVSYMPMYETTVRTPQGEEKKRVYAKDVKEAKQLFEQLYGGPRAVPYIPHVVPS